MHRTLYPLMLVLFLAVSPLAWSSTLASPPDPATVTGAGLPVPDALAPSPSVSAGPTIAGAACASPATGWAPVAALPVAVLAPAVDADSRYVYSAGGNSPGGPTTQFARFDPWTNTWQGLAPVPDAAYAALGVAAPGKFYVFGGINSTSVVLTATRIYDMATDTWTLGAPLPAPREQMAGAYWNGKIYITGGYDSTSFPSAQDTTWEYDIAGNTWTPRANLPTKLGALTGRVVNGVFYVFGGTGTSLIPQAGVYAFDTTAHTWSTRASLTHAVWAAASAVYAGKIWVIGGGMSIVPHRNVPESGAPYTWPQAPESTTTTQIYDPAIDSWAAGPQLSIAHQWLGGASVGLVVVAVGGADPTLNPSADTEVPVQVPLRILIPHSDGHIPPTTLRNALLSLPGVGVVDLADVYTGTVTLQQLLNFDMVVPYSNSAYSDSVQMGNVLADYQDAGGVVAALNFDWVNISKSLSGRWMTGGYSPYNAAAPTHFVTATLGTHNPDYPVMLGVNNLQAYYRLSVVLAPGATQVAAWTDGDPAVAVKGRAVAINAYLGDNPNRWTGDFARLIANAGFTLRRVQNVCSSTFVPLVLR